MSFTASDANDDDVWGVEINGELICLECADEFYPNPRDLALLEWVWNYGSAVWGQGDPCASCDAELRY